MSNCLTIADEAVDQKDTCTELTTRNIVEVILEEVLVSAVIISDKSCSHIGDFNITEDFCQQFDQIPEYSKGLDLQKRTPIQNSSAHLSQEFNLNSGESNDHSISLLTAKENLELILDSLAKREEKIKTECKVISEETLGDSELRIENGQIHIERNRRTEKESKILYDSPVENERVEGDHLNDRNSNKKIGRIETRPNKVSKVSQNFQEEPESEKNVEEVPGNQNKPEKKIEEDLELKDGSETPLVAIEELRQGWECEKPFVFGDWDGDISAPPKETVHKEEEISSGQVHSESINPHRPRACALAEEDLKKMVKEIEEINHSMVNDSDEFDTAYHPDGQGDADLDPFSCLTNGSHEEKFSNTQSSNSVSVKSTENEIEQQKSAAETEETVNQPNDESLQLQEVSSTIIMTEGTEAESQLNIKNLTLQNVKDEMGQQKVAMEIKEIDNSQAPMLFMPEGTEIVNEASINSMNLINEDNEEEQSQSKTKENINRLTPDISFTGAPELKRSENGNWTQHHRVASKLTLSDSGYLAQSESVQSDHETPDTSSDSKMCTENPSDGMRWSRSKIDTPQDPFTLLTDSSSTERLHHKNFDWDFTSSNSSSLAETKISFLDSKNSSEPENFLQTFNLCYDHTKNDLNSYDDQKSENSFLGNAEDKRDGIAMSQRDSLTVSENSEEIHKSSERILSLTESEDDKQFSQEVKDSDSKEQPGKVDTKEQSQSQSLIFESDISASETEIEEVQSEFWIQLPKPFKLHEKMYLDASYSPGNSKRKVLPSTDSEDSYIENTEKVIQIIDPAENSNDEDSEKTITFSLLSESNQNEEGSASSLPSSSENEAKESETEVTRKVYSGMTSIGPMKYTDYDPKDLTAGEIDFGKMTRITSSRQLTKDIFGMEIKAIPSAKIIEEDDDSEYENDSLNRKQCDRVDLGPLINRDIASLTKVQKVKEVMFHHPKADEDLDDDDSVTRTRLDLKDVESTTDERYKLPDVNLELVSIDVDDLNSELDKEFIETMDTVLHGTCLNTSFYEEGENEENKDTTHSVSESYEFMCPPVSPEGSGEKKAKEVVVDDGSEVKSDFTFKRKLKTSTDFIINNEDEIKGVSSNGPRDADLTRPKFNTMSSLFKKTSNKFSRKDGDLHLKNVKSLPRNMGGLNSAGSIKSLLNDCQSSVHDMLKKSRTLLRNTQSIFKAVSQTRFPSHESPTPYETSSPSETQVNHTDKKPSLFKKEDFLRAKTPFKNKKEKSFGSRDGSSSPKSESEATEEKDATAGAQSWENSPTAERLEASKKALVKSPLSHKSQFVKSQLSMLSDQSGSPSTIHDTGSKTTNQSEISASDGSKDVHFHVPEDVRDTVYLQSSEKDIELSFDETTNEVKLTWTCDEYSYQIAQEMKQQLEENRMEAQLEFEQPGYIVMETIEGLPDLDGGSSIQEIESVQLKEAKASQDEITIQSAANASFISSKLEEQNSSNSQDFSSFQSVTDDNETSMSIPAKKSKSFSEKFRSFWRIAFKRVKVLPKDEEPS